MEKTKFTASFLNVMKKFIEFPLTRIILGIFLLSKLISLFQEFSRGVSMDFFKNHVPLRIFLIDGVLFCIVIVVFYCFFVRLFERRSVKEFSRKGAIQESFLGYSIGTGIISLIILSLFLLNCYSVVGMNPVPFFRVVSSFLGGAFLQEIVTRGIIFRIVEEKLGSVIALILSSFYFGYQHFNNPHATFWTVLLISLEAGILLAAAYMVTRRLWFPIFIHWGWNLTLGSIFGLSVSGMEVNYNILNSKLSGPIYLTGGDFGPEASIITFIICSSIAIVFLHIAYKKGHFIQPFWYKKTSLVKTSTK